MKEQAIEYEYIIRAAHKVGRLGIPAAHADRFRGLERNFVSYKENTDKSKESDFLFNYAFYCGEVSTNLNNALWQFEMNFEKNLTQEDKDELDKIEALLLMGRMEQIVEALELIKTLFSKHKIVNV